MMASEIVERSDSHFLTRDDDGWALWGVDQDSDEPLLSFDANPAGEERARAAFSTRTRETRRVRMLAIAAVIAGVAWLVLELGVFAIRELIDRDDVERFSLEPSTMPAALQIATWLQSFGLLANVVFEVAVGLFVVAWLQRRWRREG
jgi:hypothetical protein